MVLTTPRLAMRELRATDAPFVRALMNEPSFIAHIGDRGVRTVEDAQRYIESGPWTRYAALGFGLWLVERRDTGEPVGVCGLLQRETLRSPDIGFAFLQRFWSNGYAFESASSVMSVAADVLHLSEVLAIVNRSNTASIRLLEKLGFTVAEAARGLEHRPDVALYAAALPRSGAPVNPSSRGSRADSADCS